MRRLMLLRHAKSDRPAGIDDHDRPLASRGRADSTCIGRYLAEQWLRPDLAIVSTARRSQETWELARPAFAHSIVQHNERRLYQGSASAILELIRQTRSDVGLLLLVGHNPGLHDLALGLIGSAGQSALKRLRRKFPTAGLIVINFDIETWEHAATGGGLLEQFETPKTAES